MLTILVIAAAIALMVWAFANSRRKVTSNPNLVLGNALPDFTCRLEDGSDVSSSSLRGSKSVLLFVRGSWCPFCSEQVKALTDYYRRITEDGGRLIIITRRPLETTKNVAEQFGVEFEFWLDQDLAAATELGLVDEEPTPERIQPEFGKRTIRPTVLVTDRDNNIRYSYRSENPTDRPDPSRFMSVFDKIA